MSTIIRLVFEFNKKVVKIGGRELKPLSRSEADWLRQALTEEAEELVNSEDLVDQVDACCDAAVFAFGGLSRLGLTVEQAEECFEAVMAANFEKRAGVKPGRTGAEDAVKPDGWVGPEERIRKILNV